MTEDATSFTITLAHPTLGTAVLRVSKGMSSTGGSFAFAPAGQSAPAPTPLLERVQGITVTDEGPKWEGSGPASVRLGSTAYSVTEGASGAGNATSVTVTVLRDGATTAPATVRYATA